MSDGKPGGQRARDLILRFESERDPFEYQIKGYSIWPLYRFMVWEHIKINMDGLTSRQSTGHSGVSRRLRAARVMVEELWNLHKLKTARREYDIVLLTTTNRLRDKTDGAYKHVYFDYCESLLRNALQIFVDARSGREPATQPSVYVSSRTVLPKVVLGGGGEPDGEERMSSLYSDLTSFLESAGCAKHMRMALSVWRRELAYFVARFNSFVEIFEATKPKVVVTDCHYDKMWAIAAAKRLRIPVVELQHGIVYDGHMAYTYDPRSASPYRDRIPLPDKYLAFGPYFSEILMDRGFWSESQVEDVGFPRMEYHQSTFAYTVPKTGEDLRVLISSQWIMTEKLCKFLEATVRRLPENVILNVKPHPLERDTGAYRQIDGLGVLDGGEEFYELLGKHHVHCSVFSTTLLESVGLGVPTIILGLPGSENALPMSERGHCNVVNSPGEFAAVLARVAENASELEQWHRNTIENRSYFWEPNASANIQALLDEIAGPAAQSAEAGREP
jgi:hypothetical protein